MDQFIQKTVSKKASSTSIRTLQILKFLSLCVTPVGISEIASSLREERNAVRRSLEALYQEGFVYKADKNKYELSASVLQLCNQFYDVSDTQKVVAEYLDIINEETGEVSTYDIMEETSVVIVDYSDNKRHEKLSLEVGDKIPGHCSSAGRIMAANNFLKAVPLITQSLDYYTDKTITDPSVFLRELQKAHDQGYAFCHEEWMDGVACVGSAIREKNGVVESGISIGGAAKRYSKAYARELGEYVCGKCEEISKELQNYSSV